MVRAELIALIQGARAGDRQAQEVLLAADPKGIWGKTRERRDTFSVSIDGPNKIPET